MGKKRSAEGFKQSLAKSRKDKQDMLERFGFIPTTVLKLSRGQLSKKMFIYQHEETARSGSNSRSADTATEKDGNVARQDERNELLRQQAEELGAGDVALAGYSGSANRQAASIMPAELVDFFVKYYATSDGVYCDPFMGQGIRMQVADYRGLTYYGMDLSREFFAFTSSVREKMKHPDRLFIHNGDSRHPDEIPDDVGTFCFTSPPYWDIEFYGPEEEQLGNGSYEEFLDGMFDVAKAWLPKFKSGAIVVINVGDFRRDGRFFAYQADTIELFKRAGYVVHDNWIIEGLVGGMRRVFGVDSNLSKLPPRIHEYAIVFKVP